ncbi:MAG: threonine/serine exporter family protein [Clostridia bacterium]
MEENNINGQDIAFRMGKILLENGAEISRVQETMCKVAKSFNVEDFDVYVLTNGLFANGVYNGKNTGTKFSFVPSFTIHFGRIEAVNQLSREIHRGEVDILEAFERIEKIEKIEYTKLWKKILACALGSACFTYMFGGTIIDSLVAMLCGLCVEAFLNYLGEKQMAKFITNIMASAMVTVISVLAFTFGIGDNLALVITGSIIRLVPGMAMTTSIRDFFSGDYLSGTIRLIDALIIGGSIAVGVGAVISLFSMILGGAISL